MKSNTVCYNLSHAIYITPANSNDIMNVEKTCGPHTKKFPSLIHLRSALYCKAVRQLPIINFYAFIGNIRLKRIFFIHLRISILSCSNNARWYNCSCVRPEIIKSEIRKKTHYTIFHNLIVANKSRAFPVRAFDLGNEKSSIVLRSFSASIAIVRMGGIVVDLTFSFESFVTSTKRL